MATINKRYVEAHPVDDLETHPENPRQGDIGAVVESIEAHGFYGALVVQESTNRVIAGNHRLIAAQQAGVEDVPVVFLDVDDDEARRIMLADNRTSDLATYDDDTLAVMLEGLAGTEDGLVGTGFDGDALDDLLTELSREPNRPWDRPPPEALPEAVTEKGDVWEVAGQIIVCGDATDPDVYERMPGEADLLLTDPPYGIGYSGGGKERVGLDNDDLDEDEFTEFIDGALETILGRCRPGAALYVMSPPGPACRLMMNVLHDRDVYRWNIVWVKDTATFGRADYHQRHEFLLYGWKPGAAHRAVEDRSETTVWEYPRPKHSDEHATMKPVELCRRAIRNSSAPGELVLDPFLGSGSTLVAAAMGGRVGFGVELQPSYVDVAVRRVQDATGEKAVHAVTGEQFPIPPDSDVSD